MTETLSFRCKETEKIWKGKFSKTLSPIKDAILRKLTLIQGATDLNDLRIPPANHLEALKGDREGQHSIRVNDQYRVCFVWNDGKATDVEVVDYH